MMGRFDPFQKHTATRRAAQLCVLAVLLFSSAGWSSAVAEDPPEGTDPASEVPLVPVVNITDKWTVLVNPARPRPGVVEFTEKSPIQNVADFKLVGPSVGHPFCLGDFIVDGKWASVQGTVQVTEGKNALLSLATADQFEMEGVINQEGLGGWLVLLGWNQGHGFSLSNVTLKDSGAPWFVCEYRAAEAIVLTNNEVKQYLWKGDQPFHMIVKNKLLSVTVGKTPIVEEYPLDNYTAGQIYFGTYDTKYGPRPVKIRSLRIRAIEEKPEKAPKPKKGEPPAAAPAKPKKP